jgi:DNA-binding XRE family transcriptional regulator
VVKRGERAEDRVCAGGCGVRLSRYNPSDVCAACGQIGVRPEPTTRVKPGAMLRQARMRRGLSQAALARHMGISNSYLSKLEGGTRAMKSLSTVLAFAAVLRVPATHLVPWLVLDPADGSCVVCGRRPADEKRGIPDGS